MGPSSGQDQTGGANCVILEAGTNPKSSEILNPVARGWVGVGLITQHDSAAIGEVVGSILTGKA